MGNLSLSGSMTMSVADVIDGQANADVTFNGPETIVPIRAANGTFTVRIDSDQLVKGRVIIFKIIQGTTVLIRTEGSEQIQHMRSPLADTATLKFKSVKLCDSKTFSDGSNWYDITGTRGNAY